MTMLEVKCPHCGALLSIQEEWIGMTLECPECKKDFCVQNDQVTPDSADPAPTESVQSDNSGTFTFVCPSCRAAAELPVSLMGQKYECRMCFEEHVARATTEKQCPYCGQTIKYHAMTCKYCGADLTKTPPRSESKTEKTFVFICPECDTAVFLPVSMKGRQYECEMCSETSVAQPAGERKCPHCGEKIKINAVVCRHCNQKVKPLIDLKQRRSRNIGRTAFGLWMIAAVLAVLYCVRLLPWSMNNRVSVLRTCAFAFMLTGLSLELLSPKRRNLIAGGIVFFTGAAMGITSQYLTCLMYPSVPSRYIWLKLAWTYLWVIVFLFAWYRQKGNGQPDKMIPAASQAGQQTALPAAVRLDCAGRIAIFMWLAGAAANLLFRILTVQKEHMPVMIAIVIVIWYCLSEILLSGSIILELLSTERKYRIAGLIGFSLGMILSVAPALNRTLSFDNYPLNLVFYIFQCLSSPCFLLAAFLFALKRNYDIKQY